MGENVQCTVKVIVAGHFLACVTLFSLFSSRANSQFLLYACTWLGRRTGEASMDKYGAGKKDDARFYFSDSLSRFTGAWLVYNCPLYERRLLHVKFSNRLEQTQYLFFCSTLSLKFLLFETIRNIFRQ